MDKREPDMVMVPREPTERMLRAAAGHMRVDTLYTPKSIWRAMLSAAPSEGGDEPSSPGPAVDREAGVEGDLTAAERAALRSLQRLAKRWPPSLWLLSAAGSLCVMKYDEDGERLRVSGGGMDPRAAIATINIPNDGVDW